MATYKDSGVDIDAADSAKELIKGYVRSTFTKDSINNAGFFCGGIKLDLGGYNDPVLMASTDGVGTKMMIARMMNRFDTVGFDLVNHSANDLITSGAKPLIFLDYIASEMVDPKIASELVKGVAAACKKLGMVLVGGETAQMPGVYVKGETDLAGTIVGIVEKSGIIDGSSIKEGDSLVGIASNGLHTNGYSLARKILFDHCGFGVNDYFAELGGSLGDVLLEPHRDYVSTIFELSAVVKIKGIAHITGGGITDNLPRILPKGLGAVISTNSWVVPHVFRFLQEKGDVHFDDMFRTFNMGIGIIVVVDKSDVPVIVDRLKRMGEKSCIMGSVVRGKGVSYVEG
ncbi:phosphoribosylformylglycinamidine cyclo-ligase [Candidatus Woesearchaeota archaeon]|nr:phosphoribosylformylglycinamidine cyclo-ligase [Candidatus Woesearchaeota archaeon]